MSDKFPVPYLPSLGWYRAFTAWRLGLSSEFPKLPRHFTRATVTAPFGDRVLSVAIEGGRKQISARRYFDLKLSEHGGWRHTHWSTIASAYGSTPYFHLYEMEFERIFNRRYDYLSSLCFELHRAIEECASLRETFSWIQRHPEAEIKNPGVKNPNESLSILHLLFQEGPNLIFSLLPPHSLTSVE